MKVNGKIISKEEEKMLRQIMYALFAPRDIDEKYATLDGKLIFENNHTGESVKFCGKDNEYYHFIMKYYSCWGDKYKDIDYFIKIENGCAYTYEDGIIDSLVVCLNKTENDDFYIKNGTKLIYDFAFKNCKFNNVIVPDSVGSISKDEFFPSSIKKITLKSRATKIWDEEDKCFNKRITFGKTELESLIKEDGSLIIPDNITKIPSYAFYNCKSLTNIVIPNSVKNIGLRAFEGCTSLTKVNYTGTIDQWAEIEFDYDRSNHHLNGYSNPLYYAKNLYINNKLATNIVLTTATKINREAFCKCTSITSVVLGEGIKSIGLSAFEGCTSLMSIVLPNSVKSIGWRAFCDCPLLKGNFDDINYYITVI